MTLAFGRNRNRHCSRCGRELEDPASEERGVGPICAAKDTVLFARAIPANYAGATAILLGMPYMTALPQEVQAMFLEVRGSEEPYTVPANQADAFLEAVRDFWPLYQGDLEEIRQKAQEWLRTRPVVVAPSQPVAASGSPPVSLQMHTLTGYDAGEWMEISFPWIVSKQAEMYALVNDLKAAVPYRDRKYNPQTRSWMFRVSHREAVTVILRRLFTV